jgi:hypothetical protein
MAEVEAAQVVEPAPGPETNDDAPADGGAMASITFDVQPDGRTVVLNLPLSMPIADALTELTTELGTTPDALEAITCGGMFRLFITLASATNAVPFTEQTLDPMSTLEGSGIVDASTPITVVLSNNNPPPGQEYVMPDEIDVDVHFGKLCQFWPFSSSRCLSYAHLQTTAKPPAELGLLSQRKIAQSDTWEDTGTVRQTWCTTMHLLKQSRSARTMGISATKITERRRPT